MHTNQRLFAFGIVLLGGCHPEKPVETPSPVAPTGVVVAKSDFGQLLWINGTWRGAEDGGKPFFERYHFIDDSTLLVIHFTDSLLSEVTADSSVIIWRDGTIAAHNGSAYSVVTTLDSNSVHFEPVEGITNAYTWSRVSADAWEAILESKDSAGQASRIVYDIRRYIPHK